MLRANSQRWREADRHLRMANQPRLEIPLTEDMLWKPLWKPFRAGTLPSLLNQNTPNWLPKELIVSGPYRCGKTVSIMMMVHRLLCLNPGMLSLIHI